MLQKIVDFQQDQLGDWVAILVCGHSQHVRHNPPWNNRPWVESNEGRMQKIGYTLNCKKCEFGAPQDVRSSEAGSK